MKRILLMKALALGIVLLDQGSKLAIREKFHLGETLPLIDGFFSFTYVRNPGAAFGFLASASESLRKPLFLLLPVLACGWLLYLIWKSRKDRMLPMLSYTLILSGAIGNLIDRFRFGYVVDFLDFYWKNHHYPAFNVADSAITIAVILLIIDMFIHRKDEKEVLLQKES